MMHTRTGKKCFVALVAPKVEDQSIVSGSDEF